MRDISVIDDVSWQDLHDRDAEIRKLRDRVESLTSQLNARAERVNIDYVLDDFVGIEGYGPFSLKKLSKDRWEIQMLHEKVVLYNRKGHRVRGDLNVTQSNCDGDW